MVQTYLSTSNIRTNEMNLSNGVRQLVKIPRWLLRRAGFDIIRFRGLAIERRAGGRRQELGSMLASITAYTITAGPFQGVRLPVAESWGDGDSGSKLLGFY